MKGIIITILVCFVTSFLLSFILFYTAEWAYFEGQKDALEGDIRIGQDSSGVYYWSKSPWNSNRGLMYHPN